MHTNATSFLPDSSHIKPRLNHIEIKKTIRLKKNGASEWSWSEIEILIFNFPTLSWTWQVSKFMAKNESLVFCVFSSLLFFWINDPKKVFIEAKNNGCQKGSQTCDLYYLDPELCVGIFYHVAIFSKCFIRGPWWKILLFSCRTRINETSA